MTEPNDPARPAPDVTVPSWPAEWQDFDDESGEHRLPVQETP